MGGEYTLVEMTREGLWYTRKGGLLLSKAAAVYLKTTLLTCGNGGLFWSDLMIVQRKSETPRSRGEKMRKKGRKYFTES